MRKKLIIGAIVLSLLTGVHVATTRAVSVLSPQQGGTGIASTSAGNIGKALIVSSTSPFLYTFGNVGSGTGGGTGSFNATGSLTQLLVFTGTSTGLGYGTLTFNTSTLLLTVSSTIISGDINTQSFFAGDVVLSNASILGFGDASTGLQGDNTAGSETFYFTTGGSPKLTIRTSTVVFDNVPGGVLITGGGFQSLGIGANSTIIGSGALASFDDNIAIGVNASSSGNSDAIAIGTLSSAGVNDGIAIGYSALIDGGQDNIAIGTQAHTNAVNTVAIGNDANVHGQNAVGLGRNVIVDTSSIYSIAIGDSAFARDDSPYSIILGYQAYTNFGSDSITIGRQSHGGATSSIAIGLSAASDVEDNISIGHLADSQATSAISIGANAYTAHIASPHGIAIGDTATVGDNNPYSIALGRSALTTAANQFMVGPFINRFVFASSSVKVGFGTTSPAFLLTVATATNIFSVSSTGQVNILSNNLVDAQGNKYSTSSGGAVTFLANGSGFVTTSTIGFTAGSNVTITTSTDGTYTIAASGGGGGGVATSSAGVYNEGNIAFIINSSTISASSSLKLTSSTGLFEVYGVGSSTEFRSPSSTITTSTLTSLIIGGDTIKDFTGTGLFMSGNTLTNSGVLSINGVTGTMLFAASGQGLTYATSGQNATYTWTNPGYLANASITANAPITWSAGNVIDFNTSTPLTLTGLYTFNNGLTSGSSTIFSGTPVGSTSTDLIRFGPANSQNGAASGTFIGGNFATSTNYDLFHFQINSSTIFRIASSGLISQASTTLSGSLTVTPLGTAGNNALTVSSVGLISTTSIVTSANSITGGVNWLASGPGLTVASSGQNITYTFSSSSLNLGSMSNINSPVPVANGGTETTTAPTDSQILSASGTLPRWKTLTAGANITISTSTTALTIAGNAGTLTGNGTVTRIPFYNGATDFLTASTFTFASSTGLFTAPSSSFTGLMTVNGTPPASTSTDFIQFGPAATQNGNASGTFFGGNFLNTTNFDLLHFQVNSTTMLKVASTGNFSIDGTTFFADVVNNRVGIGTTTPQNLFTVATGTKNLFLVTANGSSTFQPVASGTAQFVINDGSGNSIFQIDSLTTASNTLSIVNPSSSQLDFGVATTGMMLTPGTTTALAIGGASLGSGTCTSTTAVVNNALNTSTDWVNVTPQNYPGAGVYWRGYISAVGTNTSTIKAEECAATTTTPTATKFNIQWGRNIGN